MLIAITILLDILKNEGMTNCDWKANSMKASGQTRIGFPVLVTVTLSLDYLLFRYFQYAFHPDVFFDLAQKYGVTTHRACKKIIKT